MFFKIAFAARPEALAADAVHGATPPRVDCSVRRMRDFLPLLISRRGYALQFHA